jgi:drug/metabolite transporter (DMT)-like permease
LNLAHIIGLALILFLAFFLYLLFTQPANALWMGERIVVAIWTFISLFIKGLIVIVASIFRLISRLWRKR